jgi:hypothetical protein
MVLESYILNIKNYQIGRLRSFIKFYQFFFLNYLKGGGSLNLIIRLSIIFYQYLY